MVRTINPQGLSDPSPMSDPVRTQGNFNSSNLTGSIIEQQINILEHQHSIIRRAFMYVAFLFKKISVYLPYKVNLFNVCHILIYVHLLHGAFYEDSLDFIKSGQANLLFTFLRCELFLEFSG